VTQSEMANYWSGQIVECRIVRAVGEGYEVAVGTGEQSGVLPSKRSYEPGETVFAQYVSPLGEQLFLRELSNSRSPYVSLRNKLSEEPNLTSSLKFKRATDLLVPPVDDVVISNYKSDTTDFQQLCSDLAQQEFTGCIKSFNQNRVSRAGALIYAGRVVGCIYGNKSLTEPSPVLESLEQMKFDASDPGAEIRIYELPESVVLASSALFLGCPLTRNDDLSTQDYLAQMREWLKLYKQTACFACCTRTTTWLDFYHDGEYCGTFCVEDQKFYRSENFLPQKLDDPESHIELALLSPEIGEAEGGVGFALV
jgi:hypothetical protein